MSIPECIKPHAADYRDGSWKEYSLEELAWWVHLLLKRSTHRENKDKQLKDLDDAKNYLAMAEARPDYKETRFFADIRDQLDIITRVANQTQLGLTN